VRPHQGESRLDPKKSKPKTKDDGRDLEKEGKDFADLLKKPGPASAKSDPPPGILRDGGQSDSLAGSILQSMQSQGAEASMEARPVDGSFSISDVTRAIADKLLVSESSLSGKEEIRIVLKETVLPATEVRISKEGGRLGVELITASEDAFRMLSSEKINLEQRLMDRLNDSVSVQVRFNETDQGDNQGRSRQQRNLYDETRED
jgi:type III secretion system needle length determinant